MEQLTEIEQQKAMTMFEGINSNGIRLLKDEEQLKIKLQNIAFELEDTQIAEIQKKFNNLRKSVLLDSTIFLSSLFASAHFGLNALPALVGIGGNVVKNNLEKWDSIKDNPAYFLWKLKNTGQ